MDSRGPELDPGTQQGRETEMTLKDSFLIS